MPPRTPPRYTARMALAYRFGIRGRSDMAAGVVGNVIAATENWRTAVASRTGTGEGAVLGALLNQSQLTAIAACTAVPEHEVNLMFITLCSCDEKQVAMNKPISRSRLRLPLVPKDSGNTGR